MLRSLCSAPPVAVQKMLVQKCNLQTVWETVIAVRNGPSLHAHCIWQWLAERICSFLDSKKSNDAPKRFLHLPDAVL